MSSPGFRGSARVLALAVAATLALAGCGEISNTITAVPGTADTLTVALPTAPGPNYVGIYEAQARGYFRQADLDVRLLTPSSPGTTDQLPALAQRQVKVALSSEPAVFAARSANQPLVSVAAVIHGPLEHNVKITVTRTTSGGSKTSGGSSKTRSSKTKTRSSTRSGTKVTKTVTYKNLPDLSLVPSSMRTLKGLPGYDGLVMVVRKETIVNRPALIRRFVQAVARGYRAAQSDPTQAVADLIRADPALGSQRTQLTNGVRWVLAAAFPGGGHPWGWQTASAWNAFGTWMYQQKLLTDPNAAVDASTNELLAGQGV